MKTKTLASLALITLSGAAFAAPAESTPAARQLQIYPKNLARQHVGTNLFLFNPTNQTYTPTEAAAAWLDDDVTTGWPVMAGKQHYLVSLAEPQLLTNFSISARAAEGTITIYAGDEPAVPGAKSWSPVAKDIAFDSVNQKKLAKPFSRFAKYILIETNIADPGPLFSLYIYGERPAVAYDLHKREQAIDVRSIFGPFVNEPTSVNVAALYSNARVANATSTDGFLSWQKAVDENPESGITISPTTDKSGAVINLESTRTIKRLAVLADPGTKGRLEVFVVPSAATASSAAASSEFIKVSNPAPAATAAPAAVQPASLTGLNPAATLDFDGTARTSTDIPGAEGGALLVRWTPANGTDSINVRELNAFSDVTLRDHELTPSLESIAELAPDGSKDGKDFKSPIGEGKDAKEPVGELLGSPYLPGSLGFPPVLTNRTRRSTPEPLSP